jgi:KGK domain
MSDRFNSLDSGEVISIQKDSQVLVGHRIFRVSELNDAIANHLKNAVDTWTDDKSNWFNTEGIDCEALRFGSSAWQKGKIRLCLEFCPEEDNTSASNHTAIGTAAVATPAPTQAASPAPAMATPAPSLHANPNIAVATDSPKTPAVEAKTNPAVGIAAVGAGVAVVAASAAAVNNVVIPNVAKVMAPAAAMATPAISDVILEPEQKPVADANKKDGLDEIAFDFDVSSDNQGTMIPNGMMELDLSDLDLERAENDYLDFETGGIPDPSLELNSPHVMGKSENSGMLIDEVWNELSQPNWPGIH